MFSRQRVLILCTVFACSVFTFSCAAQQPPTTDKPYRTTEVRVFEQPSGEAAEDFFREVEVFITWDGERLEVRGDPAQDCSCNPRCVPYRKRKVAGNEEHDPHAGNVMCGIPRVFYPPDGPGIDLTEEYRPDKPARQVRWTVRCKDGERGCFERGDKVIVRAKKSSATPPGCRPPKPPSCPGQDEPTCPPFDEQMAKISKAKYPQSRKAMTDYDYAKKEASQEQQLTLFSPETEGVFVLPAGPSRKREARGGGCRGCNSSVTSGIPNQPDFSHGPDLGWGYSVELWRDGELKDCLDPDVWVEKDG